MPLDDVTRQQLERYLDRQLSGTALAEFEQRVLREPALREEVERQRSIDGSLRSLYPAPPFTSRQVLALAPQVADDTILITQRHAPETAAHQSTATLRALPWLRRLGVAAAILGGAFGAWSLWQEYKPDPTRAMIGQPPPIVTAADYYNNKVASGFHPYWVCEDDKQFAETFQGRLGQPLLMGASTDGTRMLGLDYSTVLSPKTIGLLAEAEGKSVLVVIDQLANDNRDRIYTDCANLKVHRREIGTLVAYEITPLPQSHVLELLHIPGATAP